MSQRVKNRPASEAAGLIKGHLDHQELAQYRACILRADQTPAAGTPLARSETPAQLRPNASVCREAFTQPEEHKTNQVLRDSDSSRSVHLSDKPMSLPAPNEQLVARIRAGAMCSETCSLLLTYEEVACVFRIGLGDVRQLISTRQIMSVTIAGFDLVPVRELVEFLDDYVAISKRSAV
jgi:hypothetical protein